MSVPYTILCNILERQSVSLQVANVISQHLLFPQKRVIRRWNGNFVNLQINEKPSPINFTMKVSHIFVKND